MPQILKFFSYGQSYVIPLPSLLGKGKKIYSCSGCGEFIISVSALSSTLVFSLPLPMVEFQMQGFTFISHCLSPYFFFFFASNDKVWMLAVCQEPSLSSIRDYLFASWPSGVVVIYSWGFWQLRTLLKVRMCLVVEWNPAVHQNISYAMCIRPVCKKLISLIYLKVETLGLQESYPNQIWMNLWLKSAFEFFAFVYRGVPFY